MSSNKMKTKKWTNDLLIVREIATDQDSLFNACVNLSNEVNVCNAEKKSLIEWVNLSIDFNTNNK